jgi:hypothetical protein
MAIYCTTRALPSPTRGAPEEAGLTRARGSFVLDRTGRCRAILCRMHALPPRIRATGLALLASLAVSGCADHIGDTVRTRAANDFKCSEDEIDVTQVAGTTYRAKGCGENVVYDCVIGGVRRNVVSARYEYLCVPEGESGHAKSEDE